MERKNKWIVPLVALSILHFGLSPMADVCVQRRRDGKHRGSGRVVER